MVALCASLHCDSHHVYQLVKKSLNLKLIQLMALEMWPELNCAEFKQWWVEVYSNSRGCDILRTINSL
jgi:hypothetical protein